MLGRFLFLIPLIFIASLLTGQEKLEREYRLKIEEVPLEAIAFVNTDKVESKIKWYFEENLKGNSVEAKFKFQKKKYSIEFDTSGLFQDIEIKIDFTNIPESVKKEMRSAIHEKFEKSKIKKVQSQYAGPIQSFEQFITIINPESSLQLNYEIVIKGQIEGTWNMYELTFDKLGNLKNTYLIIQRNTDNLEY